MRKILILFLAAMMTFPVCAQQTANSLLQDDINALQPTLIDNYLDSLLVYRKQLDSLKAINDSLLTLNRHSSKVQPFNNRYARLFTPLSFYPELAHRHFSLDRDETILTDDQLLIDNALLNFYIYHPEYVSLLGTPKGRDRRGKDKEEVKVDAPEIVKTPVEIVVPKAEEVKIDEFELFVMKPNFWTISGDAYLQIMQNYYSGNWYQGGESNYSALGRLTLQANYNNKQKVKFENKLEMNLGFQTNKSDTVHTVKSSSDLLRYTGKLGLQASKKWYYTLQIVGSSQFARSFASNSHVVNSAFLAPATVNASVGMDYTMSWFKKKLTGTIHLAPLAANYKYVSLDDLVKKHGIEEGKHSIIDYGSTFTFDANWKISDNVQWKTRLYGYTTYHRLEMQWENTFNLKISRYISANVYIYPRYDDSRARDDDFGYYQLKEYTSLGLTYSF